MATTVNLDFSVHDYVRIIVTAEGIVGSVGFILNAGLLLILLRLKERNALLTMTMSLSLSDMLTGLFHTFVLINLQISFQDFGTTTLVQSLTTGMDLDISDISNVNKSWSLVGEKQEPLWFMGDFEFGDLFNLPNGGVAFDRNPQTSLDGLENVMNDMFQRNLSTTLQELEKDLFRQTPGNITSVNVSLSHYQFAIVIVHFLYIVPYMSCILNILGLSLCLLIIITKPLTYRMILTKLRVRVYICIVWFVAVISSMAPCIYVMLMRNALLETYSVGRLLMAVTTVANLINLLALLMIYSIILFAINCLRDSSLSTYTRRRSVKSVVTAIAIVGSYALCYLPSIWTYIFQGMLKDNAYIIKCDPFYLEKTIWIRILPLLAALNTIVDSLVYALRLQTVLDRVVSFLVYILNAFKRKQSNVKPRRDAHHKNGRTQEQEMEQRGRNVTECNNKYSDKF